MRLQVMARLAISFALGWLLAGGTATAHDEALVAAAKAEGQVAVYGCDPLQTPIYIEQFKKLYPDIKVTSYLAGCWQIYNRHVSERSAGRQVADVFFSIDDAMSKAQAEKLLQPYRSPELGNFPKVAVPEGKDYVLAKILIFGITSNRDFVKGISLPKDWIDFATPQLAWKGLISYYDPRTSSAAFSLLAALHQNLGPDKTASIYEGLVASGAALAPTTPAGLSKLLSGEQPIMFYSVNNHFGGAVAKGAPLDFTLPTSGTVAINFAIAPLAGAPHPAAAKLFIDFMLNEAQGTIADANEYALKIGSKPPSGLPPLDKIKLLPLDVEKALAQQKDLIDWWQNVTGVH